MMVRDGRYASPEHDSECLVTISRHTAAATELRKAHCSDSGYTRLICNHFQLDSYNQCRLYDVHDIFVGLLYTQCLLSVT